MFRTGPALSRARVVSENPRKGFSTFIFKYVSTSRKLPVPLPHNLSRVT